MKINPKIIEENLQAFFEEKLHFFSDHHPFVQLSKDLLEVMEKDTQQVNDQRYIPNIYRISVKKSEVLDSLDLSVWRDFIVELINETSRSEHLSLPGPIHIQFFYDPQIDSDFSIQTASSTITSGKTIPIPISQDAPRTPDESIQAYLVTPYDSIYPIQKKITNIGRKEDNDVVIDNLRVSRVHAQIREVDGKHMLFDLDSTSGTKVNGQRISQCTLSSGDVIDIGDTPLIYSQEEEGSRSDKSTTKSFNPHGDQP